MDRAWRRLINSARNRHATDDVLFDNLVAGIKAAKLLRARHDARPTFSGRELKVLADLTLKHGRSMVRRASAVLLVLVLSDNAAAQARALSANAAWYFQEWLIVTPAGTNSIMSKAPIGMLSSENLSAPRAPKLLATSFLLLEGVRDRDVLAEIKAGPDGLTSVVSVRLCREMKYKLGQKPGKIQRGETEIKPELELWRGPGTMQDQHGSDLPHSIFFVVTALVIGMAKFQSNDSGERFDTGAFFCHQDGVSRGPIAADSTSFHNQYRPVTIVRTRAYDCDPGVLNVVCIAEAYASELNVLNLLKENMCADTQNSRSSTTNPNGGATHRELQELIELVGGTRARYLAAHMMHATTHNDVPRCQFYLQPPSPDTFSSFDEAIFHSQRKNVRELAARCARLLVAAEGQTYAVRRSIMLQVITNINKGLIQRFEVPRKAAWLENRQLESTKIRNNSRGPISALTTWARRSFVRSRDTIVAEMKRATLAALQSRIGATNSTAKNGPIEYPEHKARVDSTQDRSNTVGTNVLEFARLAAIEQLLFILNPSRQPMIYSKIENGTLAPGDGFVAPQVCLGRVRKDDQSQPLNSTGTHPAFPSKSSLVLTQAKFKMSLCDTKLNGRSVSRSLHKMRKRINAVSEKIQLECLERTIDVERNYHNLHRNVNANKLDLQVTKNKSTIAGLW